MLTRSIKLDLKSGRSIAELNNINLVQSQINLAVSVPTAELLYSDVSHLQKSDLVNVVQSIILMFDISP